MFATDLFPLAVLKAEAVKRAAWIASEAATERYCNEGTPESLLASSRAYYLFECAYEDHRQAVLRARQSLSQGVLIRWDYPGEG